MNKNKIKKIIGITLLIITIFFLLRKKNSKLKILKPQGPRLKLTTENKVFLGKILYHTRGCVQCHGDTGSGDGRRSFKKKMKIKPSPFRKGSLYKNGLTREGIKKTLVEGIKTDEVYYMPRYWYLQEDDMDALAEYILFLSDS